MVDPDFRDIPTGCHVIDASFRVEMRCTDRRQIVPISEIAPHAQK